MTIWEETMSANPWAEIAHAGHVGELKGRRAEAGHPFDFFRCRDAHGRPLFLLEFAPESRGVASLPNLRGLEIHEQVLPDSGKRQLVVVLRDEANVDLFHRLCLDLLDATRACEDERAAVALTIARLVRWQQLLRTGRSERLSENEQKGLIGELLFLRDTLFPIFGATDSVLFWKAAVEGEGRKDFSIGRCAVEVKARSGTAPSRVQISSDDQLDQSGYRALFLAVYELGVASARTDSGFCLSDLVSDVRKCLSAGNATAGDLFEQRLEASGYSDAHDYGNDRYVHTGSLFHRVGTGFPRIIRADVPAGVHNVAYQLDLSACSGFRVAAEELSAVLGEEA